MGIWHFKRSLSVLQLPLREITDPRPFTLRHPNYASQPIGRGTNTTLPFVTMLRLW